MPNKEKYNSIISSSLTLFSKYGFHNTTIAQIAKNIAISAGSIYSYFPSKNSLAKASITFLSGEKVLEEDLEIYIEDLSSAICRALA